MKSLSHVWLSMTPWTIAYQAPPSVEFSRQEYWSGLPFPSPEDLPNPGIKPRSLALQADALPSEPPGKPLNGCRILLKVDFKPEWFLLFQVDDRWWIVGGWMDQQTKGGRERRSEKTHKHRQKHYLRVWSKTCTEKKLVWFWVVLSSLQLLEAHPASSGWSKNVPFPYTCISVRPPKSLEKTGLLTLIIQTICMIGSVL